MDSMSNTTDVVSKYDRDFVKLRADRENLGSLRVHTFYLKKDVSIHIGRQLNPVVLRKGRHLYKQEVRGSLITKTIYASVPDSFSMKAIYTYTSIIKSSTLRDKYTQLETERLMKIDKRKKRGQRVYFLFASLITIAYIVMYALVASI